MTTTTAPLALGKCPKCKGPVTCSKDEALAAAWQVLSPCCNRWTAVNSVRGTVTSRECGEHCSDATSLTCKCECGGAQHGIAWRIK